MSDDALQVTEDRYYWMADITHDTPIPVRPSNEIIDLIEKVERQEIDPPLKIYPSGRLFPEKENIRNFTAYSFLRRSIVKVIIVPIGEDFLKLKKSINARPRFNDIPRVELPEPEPPFEVEDDEGD